MSKISIVGVEGSGKTVMMAAFGDKYKHPDSSGLFLSPENPTAFSFVEVQMEQMHQGKWPNATVTDSLKSLNWSLFLKRDGKNQKICDISFLDFAGEIYRLAFGDHSESEKSGLENEIAALKKHIIESDMLIVLINLSEIINGSVSNARTRETMWLSKGILDFAKRETNISNIAIVFSQADVYNTIISTYGGVQKTYEHFLPHCANVYPDIPIIPVSAINKTTPDENGLAVPDQGFESEGLDDLMRLIVGIFPDYRYLLDEIEENERKQKELKDKLIEAQLSYLTSFQKNLLAQERYNLALNFLQVVQNSTSGSSEYSQYVTNAQRAVNFETQVLDILDNINVNAPDIDKECLVDSKILILGKLFSTFPEFRNAEKNIESEFDLVKLDLQKKDFHFMVNHAIENITAESIEKSINYFSEAIEKYPFLRQDTYVNIDWIKEKQHKLQKEKFDKLLPQVYAAVKSDDINASLLLLEQAVKTFPAFASEQANITAHIVARQKDLQKQEAAEKRKAKVIKFFSLFLLCVLVIIGCVHAVKYYRAEYQKKISQKKSLGYSVLQQQGNDNIVWVPGKKHDTIPGIVTSKKELFWELIPGYRWQDNIYDITNRSTDINTIWVKGLPHSTMQNVVSGDQEAVWEPAPGYSWSNNDHSNVHWQSGIKHPQYTGIISSAKERVWCLLPGYQWKARLNNQRERRDNLETCWVAGILHPTILNIKTDSQVDKWQPLPGYQWKDSSKSSVHWCVGVKHPYHKGIYSHQKEHFWTLAPGYCWKQNAKNNDPRKYNLDAFWNISSLHPELDNVIADKEEGKWLPAPGYTWSDSNKNRVLWHPHIAHSRLKGIESSNEEKKWIPSPGYVWLDKNVEGSTRQVHLDVTWQTGLAHPQKKGIISALKEGEWELCPGYAWQDQSNSNRITQTTNLDAVWKVGWEYTAKGITASNEEGGWKLMPGYVWADTNLSDTASRKVNISARWEANITHPMYPNIVSDSNIGKWKPQLGFIWDGQWKVRWNSGAKHPSFEGVIASTEEDTWTLHENYMWKCPPRDQKFRKTTENLEAILNLENIIVRHLILAENEIRAYNWDKAIEICNQGLKYKRDKRLTALIDKIQDKREEASRSKHYVTPPLGILRGLATITLSPANYLRILPAMAKLEEAQTPIDVLVIGPILYTLPTLADIVLGTLDIVSLGYFGNSFYDYDYTPWFWQRQNKKVKKWLLTD